MCLFKNFSKESGIPLIFIKQHTTIKRISGIFYFPAKDEGAIREAYKEYKVKKKEERSIGLIKRSDYSNESGIPPSFISENTKIKIIEGVPYIYEDKTNQIKELYQKNQTDLEKRIQGLVKVSTFAEENNIPRPFIIEHTEITKIGVPTYFPEKDIEKIITAYDDHSRTRMRKVEGKIALARIEEYSIVPRTYVITFFKEKQLRFEMISGCNFFPEELLPELEKFYKERSTKRSPVIEGKLTYTQAYKKTQIPKDFFKMYFEKRQDLIEVAYGYDMFNEAEIDNIKKSWKLRPSNWRISKKKGHTRYIDAVKKIGCSKSQEPLEEFIVHDGRWRYINNSGISLLKKQFNSSRIRKLATTKSKQYKTEKDEFMELVEEFKQKVQDPENDGVPLLFANLVSKLPELVNQLERAHRTEILALKEELSEERHGYIRAFSTGSTHILKGFSEFKQRTDERIHKFHDHLEQSLKVRMEKLRAEVVGEIYVHLGLATQSALNLRGDYYKGAVITDLAMTYKSMRTSLKTIEEEFGTGNSSLKFQKAVRWLISEEPKNLNLEAILGIGGVFVLCEKHELNTGIKERFKKSIKNCDSISKKPICEILKNYKNTMDQWGEEKIPLRIRELTSEITDFLSKQEKY